MPSALTRNPEPRLRCLKLFGICGMKRRKNCSKGSFSPNGPGLGPPGPPGPPPGPPGPPPGPPGPPPGPPGPPPGPPGPGNGPKPRNPSFLTVCDVEMLTTAASALAATSAKEGSAAPRLVATEDCAGAAALAAGAAGAGAGVGPPLARPHGNQSAANEPRLPPTMRESTMMRSNDLVFNSISCLTVGAPRDSSRKRRHPRRAYGVSDVSRPKDIRRSHFVEFPSASKVVNDSASSSSDRATTRNQRRRSHHGRA